MLKRDIFDLERLPPALTEFIRSSNPWWEGKPGRVLPPFRRWAFAAARARLEAGLAPIVVLRGPRQVGKTTIQEQLIQAYIGNGVEPRRLLRLQFDELPPLRGLETPVLTLCRWFENRVLGQTFNEAAHAGRWAYIFLDEVQNLDAWAPQLKALVDHHTVHVLVTGSSALRIEAGRDSLAGRITQLDLGPLLLREIAEMRGHGSLAAVLPENGLAALLDIQWWRELVAHGLRHREIRDAAMRDYSVRGGCPIAQERADRPWPEVADQLNDTVIKRVIQHDLRLGERGRKRDPNLLEEVFRLACRYAGQAPGPATFVNEIRSALHANIGWQRILIYLKFLDGSLLVRLIDPLELCLKKKKRNAKLCLCDPGLRLSWLQELIPIDREGLRDSPHLSDLAGHLAESVTGYFLGNLPGLDLAHFPERGAEPEVDFVLTVGERRIPLEVKYRHIIDPHRDTTGLRAFIEKTANNAPFGVLVTLEDGTEVRDPRIVALPLSSLLFMQ
jgi:predicted AAA+ superfamily ATPase